MAIAIRGGTPKIFTSLVATVGGTLSGAWQPQAGDRLVLIHCNDYYSLSNMPTPTAGGNAVTAITGPGVPADGGDFFAHAKPYEYSVGSSGDLAVTVTETGGGGGEEKALIVYVLSGVDGTTTIDAAAGLFDSTQIPATANNVCPAVSPASSDAYLIAHTNDGGGASSGAVVTNPSGMSNSYDQTFGAMSFCGAVQQLSASGSTGTKTFVKTTAGRFYATLTIAVKTAGGASATVSASTVAATTAVGAPTPAGGAGATPATVAAVATIGVPTVKTGGTATPVTVAAAASIGTPTVIDNTQAGMQGTIGELSPQLAGGQVVSPALPALAGTIQ